MTHGCASTLCLLATLAAAATAQPVNGPAREQRQVTPLIGRLPEAGAYKSEAGPFEVATVDLALTKGPVEKSLPVRVHTPDAAGGEPMPLLVISPIRGAGRDAFASFATHVASHGFVVVVVTHDDATGRAEARATNRAMHAEALGPERASIDPHGRIADLSAVLDSADELQAAVGDRAHIDFDRVAVLGHDAGARAAFGVLGVEFTTPSGGAVVARDDRYDCAILVSPPGATRPEFDRTAWRIMTAPTLIVTGTSDFGGIEEDTPASTIHAYEYGVTECTLAVVEGARRMSYLEPGPESGPIRANAGVPGDWYARGVLRSMTLAFLDRKLKDDPRAAYYLGSDAILRMEGGRTEIQKRSP